MKKTLALLVLVLMVLPGFAFDSGKNPKVSALLSLGLPGGGQFYNEKPWKGSLAIGIESFLVYKIIDTGDFIDELKSDIRRYEKILEDNNLTDDQVAKYQELIEGRRAKYNRNKNRQDNHYWWLGGTIFLSVIDAYVDAHLFNYDEKKKNIRLNFSARSLSLSYKF